MIAGCHPDQRRYANGLCKPCYQKEWMAAHPGYHGAWRRRRPRDTTAARGYRLRARFKMTLDEYDAMLAAQGGRCAACRTDQPGGRWARFSVDHDHATGLVRGLLCLRCNRAVGLMLDDPVTARAIASYLEPTR